MFFKIQFVKNVLVYVFSVFTFSFCYYFYEDFIHKIILVSLSLLFICISYPLKVFKFDTGIFRDSCAVPLLKILSRLAQSIAFLCLILFPMFACNKYPFRAFVTMIYWTSAEVLHLVVVYHSVQLSHTRSDLIHLLRVVISETRILCHFILILLSSVLMKQLTCNVGIISLIRIGYWFGYLVTVTVPGHRN